MHLEVVLVLGRFANSDEHVLRIRLRMRVRIARVCHTTEAIVRPTLEHLRVHELRMSRLGCLLLGRVKPNRITECDIRPKRELRRLSILIRRWLELTVGRGNHPEQHVCAIETRLDSTRQKLVVHRHEPPKNVFMPGVTFGQMSSTDGLTSEEAAVLEHALARCPFDALIKED